jgi:hypothetical protein
MATGMTLLFPHEHLENRPDLALRLQPTGGIPIIPGEKCKP